MSLGLQNRNRQTSITLIKNVGSKSVEPLYDLLSTGSSSWRHFRVYPCGLLASVVFYKMISAIYAMRRPHFRGHGANKSTSTKLEMKHLSHHFQALLKNHNLNMTQKHDSCHFQLTGSSWWRHFRWDIEIFRRYVCVNLWVASFCSFRENWNQPFT